MEEQTQEDKNTVKVKINVDTSDALEGIERVSAALVELNAQATKTYAALVEAVNYSAARTRFTKEQAAEALGIRHWLTVAVCPRCGGFHERVNFRQLARPVRIVRSFDNDTVLTHAGTCPEKGEPVLTMGLLGEVFV